MMRPLFLLLLLMSSQLTFQSCNPDCDSATINNISIASADAILAGRENQILLRSAPPNFLEGRQVFIDHPEKGPPDRLEVESFFETELQGLIVTIPEEAADVSTPAVWVDDPDCTSDFLLVDPLQIRTQDFFFFSDVFVVPPIPIVVIPTPAIAPPTNITNAWISPYERSYCIWFVPELDEQGNELPELRPYLPGIDDDRKKMDPNFMLGSHEFVVCDAVGRHENADKNPVSGFVDKEAGIIEIKIDRTEKNLGVERFTGLFVDEDQFPNTDQWRNGFAGCGDPISEDARIDFMLLTSETTGHQLLMIKALNR